MWLVSWKPKEHDVCRNPLLSQVLFDDLPQQAKDNWNLVVIPY